MRNIWLAFVGSIILHCGCEGDNKIQPDLDCSDADLLAREATRNFEMGFSTWPYAPSEEAVIDTYQFIEENADVYSEHIDNRIPWNAWINNLPLPQEFTLDIDARQARRIPGLKLALSVSLLNTDRNDLWEDFDSSVPDYVELNDAKIQDAYFRHIDYLVTRLEPDYLTIAIEVNELIHNAPEKWNAYKLLMHEVKLRIKAQYPSLQISESLTLHNLYEPEVANPQEYINELVTYANEMDYVAISFYPYFKGLHSKSDFQKAFDFLHDHIDKPIAFAETSHLAEDLSVATYNLSIEGSECGQNQYLESLLNNAQDQDYEYVIWWAHRDFTALWATFPEELQDLGKLWRNTGLVGDEGKSKQALITWKAILDK